MNTNRRSNQRGRNPLNQTMSLVKEMSLLKDIKEQLIIANVKDSNSTRERVPDVPRTLFKRNKVYTFSRKFAAPAITATTISGASGGFSFSLSQVPNTTDFSNLFDQYRIIEIAVTLIPNYIQANVPIYTAFDYDDALTPPNVFTLFEKQTCRISESDQVIERVFTPRTLRETYATAVTSGYETAVGAWIDSQNDTIPHYGFKYFIAPLPATGLTNTYAMNVELVIQGRSVA
jgi:hypothetical protein